MQRFNYELDLLVAGFDDEGEGQSSALPVKQRASQRDTIWGFRREQLRELLACHGHPRM